MEAIKKCSWMMMSPSSKIPGGGGVLLRLLLVLTLTLTWSDSFCGADVSQDRQKCANQLVGLVGCLPYVSGDRNAKAPTVDCCTGLKIVLDKSRECLCILVRDRNDPGLGFKINATLALSLPQKCNAPANISDCPALLHLAPNSPDAKVFEDFGKGGNNGTSTPAPSQADSSAGVDSSKNGGGKTIRWLRIEMVLGLLIIVALQILPNSC